MARDTTANPERTAPRPGRNASPFWFSVALIGIAVVAAPTLLFLVIAMAPSLVAFIIDRSGRKYATLCVGGINAAGTFPFLLDLWHKGHSIAIAMNILSDVFVLGAIYCAAGFGWLLFVAVPPVVATVLTLMAHRRAATLRARQQQLIAEWGEEVAGQAGTKAKAAPTPPPD